MFDFLSTAFSDFWCATTLFCFFFLRLVDVFSVGPAKVKYKSAEVLINNII